MFKKKEEISVEVVPAWQGAGESIVRERIPYGTILSHAELAKKFGMTHPSEERNGAYELGGRGLVTYMKALEKFDLTFMGNMENLRKYLLAKHKLCLDNVRGQGYRIVPPKEQTHLGLVTLSKEVKRAINKSKDIISNVRVERLTKEEMKEHADGVARHAFVSTLIRRALKKNSLEFSSVKRIDS